MVKFKQKMALGVTRGVALGLVVGLGLGLGQAWAAGDFPGLPVAVAPLTGNETIPADTNLGQGINPATELLSPGQIGSFAPAAVVVPFATTETIDSSLSNLYTTTLTANTTIANPINLVSGKKFQIEVIQGGTGSYTVTWGSLFAWPAATAPTLSTTVGYVDLITCTYDGTKLRCFAYLHVA